MINMKHTSYYLTLLFAIVSSACSPETYFIEDNTNSNNIIETILVSAKDFESVEDCTRTNIKIDNNGVAFEWEATDTIGIFPNKGYQVAFPMISGAGTQTATFSGGGWALKTSSSYAAYYPFHYNNKDVRNIPISYIGQKQVGNANTQHIGLYDYMSAKATTPVDGGVAFEFQHIGALLQFKLEVPDDVNITSLTINSSESVPFIQRGQIDLFGDNLAIKAEELSKSISIELSDISTTMDDDEIVVYMMIPPANTLDENLVLSITNDTGKVSEYQLPGKNFEAGKAYSIFAKFDIFEDYDLQIKDSRSKAIQSIGGVLDIEYLSNTECDIIIPEDAHSWIKPVSTRTATSRKHAIEIKENTSTKNRSATVLIKSRFSDLAIEYGIIQAGINSYAITEKNQFMPIGVLTGQYPAIDPRNGLPNLVDNKLETYYEVESDCFYVEWEGPYEIGAKSFGFGFIPGSHSKDDRRPSGVSISYSSDGRDWSGIGWSASSSGDYFGHYSKNIRAKRFRFEILGNDGGSTTRVAEFHLFEDPNIDDDIISFADLTKRGNSFTESSKTPMGNHYANKHITTDDDLIWLANAANEPALLKSTPNYTLRPYKVILYPSGTPIPADANQHGIGDCSAVAVLAEMAYLFPDFIKSIITDNGDETFTVAMYDPQGKPVNVAVQSTFLGDNNGLGAASGKNGEATWATVMEKAIMKWNYIYQVNPDIRGIGSEHVAPLFTGEGNSFAITPSSLSPKQLKQAVKVALDNRMIVIGGFTKSDINVGYGPKTVSAHAYSFMFSDDSDAMFAMRNPWGYAPGGDKKDDGILRIYNDGVVPPLIDLRIIYPGAAADYAQKNLYPYIPPKY